MRGKGFDFDTNNMGSVLFSFNNSDMSEEARLFLPLLFIVERFMKKTDEVSKKRIFLFSGHAFNENSESYNQRELVNFILMLGEKLRHESKDTRVAFIPNLSTDDLTELALISSVDVFEALSEDDANRASTLADFE